MTARARTAAFNGWLDVLAPVVWVAVTLSATLAVAFAWIERPVDFSLFLDSARLLRAGGDPYSSLFENGGGVNLNTPGVVWAFVPLTLMPYWLAFAVWYGASLAAMAWSVRAVARRTDASAPLMAVFSLSALSGGLSLQFGQVTGVLMPLTTFAWLADREGRGRTAGVLLGFLIYVKPFLGLYLFYWLWRREWRALAWASIVSATLAGLTFIASPTLTSQWIAAAGDVRWRALTLNGSIVGFAGRIFGGAVPYSVPTFTPLVVSAIWERTLTLTLDAVVLGISWRALRRIVTRDRGWVIVGLTALLLSPLGWSYYVPLLAGPLATISASTVVVPLALLNIPSSVLTLGRYGRSGTVLAGSFMFWTFLWLWVAALATAERQETIKG